MIFIDNLIKEDVGRNVVYTDGKGDEEDGILTSWNDKYIFVDYGKNCGRATATYPEDLRFSILRPGENDINDRFEILDIKEENE